MSEIVVIDRTGDTRIEWDPDNKTETENAEKSFKDLTKEGFTAFRMYDEGKKGQQLHSFDPKAEKIMMIPAVVGG